jgi:CHAT domain-containing protein
MKLQHWAAVLGMALLASCGRHDALPDGTAVIDETVTLTRGAASDAATREFAVNDDSIVVAFADEQLTNVQLKIGATDGGTALDSVEVENNLTGSGTEVAVLSVPEGAHVTVTLSSALDANTPGAVPLRVKLYSKAAASDPQFSALLAAARHWSDATTSAARPDSARKTGLADINQAIAGLETEHGDAALAAQARLIKARMLQFFKIDLREARAEAQRAAVAFMKLPRPDLLDAARANYIEALVLSEMSGDSASKNPDSEEARALARQSLETLGASGSAFGPIEKARAIAALGMLDLDLTLTGDASKHFEQARAMYQSAGYVSGERDMRFSLPMALVEDGRFAEASAAYAPLVPELDQIADPEFRVVSYIAVTRAQSMSGNVDVSVPLMLKALKLAREYQLRMQEATVLESLGFVYSNRGDVKQASAFLAQALKIMSELTDGAEYAFALAAAAGATRMDGDLDRAFELASEAVRRSSIPIAKARTPNELAMVYRAKGDLPRAIAELRKAMAVDLGDPHHHAHTDARLFIAMMQIDYEPSTPADLAEAGKLLREGLATSIRAQDPARQIQAYRHLGHLYARLGKNAAALENFDRALALAQQLRARSSSTEVRASMLRDEQGAFRGYLEVSFADVARRPPGTLVAASPTELAALRRLENARRASFGALRVGALDAATSAHVDDLLAQMGQKSLRIATLLDAKLDAAQTAELQSLQLDMSRLHAELDNIRWSAASPLSPSSWRALAPGAAQLSYVLAQKRVYVLVRSDSGTRMTVLAPTRDELEKQLAELAALDVRTASPAIERKLEELSAALLPPGLLPKESTSVDIVAEGRIASVSFPALRSPTDPQRRLVDTHDIVMVTSLFDVDEAPRPKAARPFRFVALASGHGTYRDAAQIDPTPKLQMATKEINVAAGLFTARDAGATIKLLTGADGNAAALRDIWATGADVVHFATHALADLRQPIASLLVLPATDEDGQATYLTAGQVQGWRGDTELVFLSACESAIGPPQFAVGMPGLQRAFLRAGARGVIATLAPIEDVLAQQFAADFYTRYTSGEPAARALSATQRAWLVPDPKLSAADQLRRRITALSHAYFSG